MEEMQNEKSTPWWKPEAYEQKIEFADGTLLKGSGSLNITTGDLWLWPKETMTISEVCQIMENTAKTQQITIYVSKMETNVYEGYTKLTTVKMDTAGALSVRMNKP